MIGDYRHLVAVEDPSAPIPDGDGGYTLAWTPLDPAYWWIAIAPATVQDQERIGGGTSTIVDKSSAIVTGRYHAGVSTSTRLRHDGITFAIAGVRHVPHRDLTEAIAVEVPPPDGTP